MRLVSSILPVLLLAKEPTAKFASVLPSPTQRSQSHFHLMPPIHILFLIFISLSTSTFALSPLCCQPLFTTNSSTVLCPELCDLSNFCCSNTSISSACAELAQRLFPDDCPAYCGNGLCDSNESCDSCIEDCGPCESARESLCETDTQTFPPNDPLFRNQWHLINNEQTQNGRTATLGMDINILRVWERGFTGKGVRVAVIDDGVQWRHQDLFCAYDKDGSGDLVGRDFRTTITRRRRGSGDTVRIDAQPVHVDADLQPLDTPRLDPTDTYVDPAYGTPQEPMLWDNHGTAVAGIISASYDNAKCGVGIAHGASLIAVRILGDNFNDWNAARALRWPNIDIYSNSWGPADDGMESVPYYLTLSAIRDGIRHGRGGLGSIYVWAGGNGKWYQDDSNYDPLANSIYTISVGATDWDGVASVYSEPGTNILVNAPSSTYSGTNESRTPYSSIFTTDRTGASGYNYPGHPHETSDSSCTGLFGGTSAACPIVSGVVALLLEANQKLTWRDVQWILVQSATKTDRLHPEWDLNAAGFWFNRYYGFGTVNAEKALSLVLTGNLVCPLHITLTKEWINSRKEIPITPETPLLFTFSTRSSIVVEHVVVTLTVSHPHRGHLILAVQSPRGTTSVFAPGRPRDLSSDIISGTSFMSVQFWGETSAGNWTIALSSVHQTGVAMNIRIDVYGSPANCSLPVDPETPINPPTPPIPALSWNRIKLVIIISVILFLILVVTTAVLVEVAKMQVSASRGVDAEILKEMMAHEDSSESDFFDTSSTSSLSTISED